MIMRQSFIVQLLLSEPSRVRPPELLRTQPIHPCGRIPQCAEQLGILSRPKIRGSPHAAQIGDPPAVDKRGDRSYDDPADGCSGRAPPSRNTGEWIDYRTQADGVAAKRPQEDSELRDRHCCRDKQRQPSGHPSKSECRLGSFCHKLTSTGGRAGHQEDAGVKRKAIPSLPHHTRRVGLRNHQRQGHHEGTRL